MKLAEVIAMRSKDPNTQVGACIVDDKNRVISLGYNGLPNNCSDDKFPWSREGIIEVYTKYPYVVHAELNAILNSDRDLKGCTIYITVSPCRECVKAIIQSGIKEIVYANEYKKGGISIKKDICADSLIKSSGIKYRKYNNKKEK